MDFVDGFNGRAVDGDKDVARPDAGRHPTATLCHIGGSNAFRARFPQDAIFQLVRCRAHGDIQGAETQEDTHQGE